jgi:D-alanine-D-alanine ligase
LKKLRILALFHWDHVPPERREDLGEKLDDVWAAFELVDALRGLGHEVRVLGLEDELAPIRHAIQAWRPHVAFNQLLDFHGLPLYDAHVVSYLELLKTPYTGCNPRSILLASDKALAKKILTYHRIPIPRFATFARGRTARKPAGLGYPLFVKSDIEHASRGISQASIVRSDAALADRVTFIHDSVGTDALAEEYIEGREMTVSILGNQRLSTMPVWELHFESLPDGTAAIATPRVKFNERYQQKLGVRTGPAAVDEDKARAITRIAKRAYRALGMSGYGRVDFRMDAEGRVFVLEANPNPDLTPGEDFAESAHHAGLGYPELLQRIVSLGLAYLPAWKEVEV